MNDTCVNRKYSMSEIDELRELVWRKIFYSYYSFIPYHENQEMSVTIEVANEYKSLIEDHLRTLLIAGMTAPEIIYSEKEARLNNEIEEAYSRNSEIDDYENFKKLRCKYPNIVYSFYRNARVGGSECANYINGGLICSSHYCGKLYFPHDEGFENLAKTGMCCNCIHKLIEDEQTNEVINGDMNKRKANEGRSFWDKFWNGWG